MLIENGQGKLPIWKDDLNIKVISNDAFQGTDTKKKQMYTKKTNLLFINGFTYIGLAPALNLYWVYEPVLKMPCAND